MPNKKNKPHPELDRGNESEEYNLVKLIERQK